MLASGVFCSQQRWALLFLVTLQGPALWRESGFVLGKSLVPVALLGARDEVVLLERSQSPARRRSGIKVSCGDVSSSSSHSVTSAIVFTSSGGRGSCGWVA